MKNVDASKAAAKLEEIGFLKMSIAAEIIKGIPEISASTVCRALSELGEEYICDYNSTTMKDIDHKKDQEEMHKNAEAVRKKYDIDKNDAEDKPSLINKKLSEHNEMLAEELAESRQLKANN